MENTTKFKRSGIFLAYPAAYLFCRNFFTDFESRIAETIMMILITLAFIGLTELVIRGRGKTPTKEGRFWEAIALGVAATITIAPIQAYSGFGWFLCIVYIAVTAGGALLQGETGKYFVRDFAMGFCNPVTSFSKWFDDAQAVTKEVSQKKSSATIIGAIIASCILFVILIAAFITLCDLDSNFEVIGSKLLSLLNYLDIDTFATIFASAIFAIPVSVGAYALLGGCADTNKETLAESLVKLEDASAKRRAVGATVFNVFIGLFNILYVTFFVTHGTTIFKVLEGKAPDGMLIADYARDGFFNLVFIMILNSLVYLVVYNFQKKAEDGSFQKSTRVLLNILMVVTVVFALLSLGRLALYFATYGYTPKRLMAIWGTVIMTLASIIIMVSTNGHKSSRNWAKFWILFTAVSYVVICVVAGILMAVGA